jgi:hypothetical protein
MAGADRRPRRDIYDQPTIMATRSTRPARVASTARQPPLMIMSREHVMLQGRRIDAVGARRGPCSRSGSDNCGRCASSAAG